MSIKTKCIVFTFNHSILSLNTIDDNPKAYINQHIIRDLSNVRNRLFERNVVQGEAIVEPMLDILLSFSRVDGKRQTRSPLDRKELSKGTGKQREKKGK